MSFDWGAPLSPQDWQAIGLTLRVAACTTLLLLLVGTPIAWWLARTRSAWKATVAAIVAMPLVLPPTVLGFYMLSAMGPSGPIGQLTQPLGLGLLPFSFQGLLLASVFYSLPFMVQPIQNAIESLGARPLEVAATLRAGPWDSFFSVVVPLAWPGFVTGMVMSFAHTVGEFGVVLMVGGNIPGQTRVVSVQIYDYVESLDYAHAHRLAAAMLLFSFAILLALHAVQQRGRRRQAAQS